MKRETEAWGLVQAGGMLLRFTIRHSRKKVVDDHCKLRGISRGTLRKGLRYKLRKVKITYNA